MKNDYPAVSHNQIGYLKSKYNFDSIEQFSTGPQSDERRYYKATRGDDTFFVKSGSRSYENEYRMAKSAYEVNQKNFVEPIDHNTGKTNYFITRWVDGVELNEFMATNVPTEKQKNSFAKDLHAIHQTLWKQGIIHRDLIPRNLLVASNRLILIDFYWSVDYKDYREYEYIANDLSSICLLGEDYAKGSFIWDDAYSLVKIMEYIGVDATNDIKKKIAKTINARSISPIAEDLYKTVITDRMKRNKLFDQNESLERRAADIDSQNQELQNQISSRDEIISSLHDKVAILQDELRNIQESYSWKITKPVRTIAGVAKRGKR